MTPVQTRAIDYIRRADHLVRPNDLGCTLWGNAPHAYRGGACSAPYARPAGKLLAALKRMGLVEWVVEGDNYGWRAVKNWEAKP